MRIFRLTGFFGLILALPAVPSFAGEFVFDTNEISMKLPPDQDRLSVEFPFTVKGDTPVTIKEYQAACSCLSAEISDNPSVSLCFLWKELERQVLICGTASRLSRETSEKYFRSRPRGHQIGAWASLQSNEIPDRQWMLEREAELTDRFSGNEIPLPDFWGGYIVKPHEIEFWQGRENRLHDRIMYRNCGKKWDKVRLSP